MRALLLMLCLACGEAECTKAEACPGAVDSWLTDGGDIVCVACWTADGGITDVKTTAHLLTPRACPDAARDFEQWRAMWCN